MNKLSYQQIFLLFLLPLVGLFFFSFDYIPRSSPIDDELYLIHAISFYESKIPTDNPLFFTKSSFFGYILYVLKLFNISLFTFLYIFKIILFYIWYYIFRNKISFLVSSLTLFFLIFHPIFFSIDFHFILRDQLNALLIILNILIIFLITNSKNRNLYFIYYIFLLFFLIIFFNLREENIFYYLFITLFFLIFLKLKLCNYILYLLIPLCLFIVVNSFVIDNREEINSSNHGYYSFLLNLVKINEVNNNPKFILPKSKITKITDISKSFEDASQHLPPPHNQSYTCKQFNVCNEWSTGFMIWWIKLLPKESGNLYLFQNVNEDIDHACNNALIDCSFFPYNLIDIINIFLKDFFVNFTQVFNNNHSYIDIENNENEEIFNDDYNKILIKNYFNQNYKISNNVFFVIKNIVNLIPTILFAIFFVSFVLFCKNIFNKIRDFLPECFFIFIFLSILFLSFFSIFIGPFDKRMLYHIILLVIFFTPLIFSIIKS